MYGKVFAEMYEGSMVGAGVVVFALWPYCIARSNTSGQVLLNPKLIAPIFGTDETEIRKALTFLLSPDPDSKNPAKNGRRLEHVGGHMYQIVSYEIYRAIKNEYERREYMREYMRDYRGKGDGKRESKCSTKLCLPHLDDGPPAPPENTKEEEEAEAGLALRKLRKRLHADFEPSNEGKNQQNPAKVSLPVEDKKQSREAAFSSKWNELAKKWGFSTVLFFPSSCTARLQRLFQLFKKVYGTEKKGWQIFWENVEDTMRHYKGTTYIRYFKLPFILRPEKAEALLQDALMNYPVEVDEKAAERFEKQKQAQIKELSKALSLLSDKLEGNLAETRKLKLLKRQAAIQKQIKELKKEQG